MNNFNMAVHKRKRFFVDLNWRPRAHTSVDLPLEPEAVGVISNVGVYIL